MPGIKHLLECHCVLPIYRNAADNQIYHKFTVYSKLSKDGKVIPKIVKCNNCDTMHKVIDICKSEISPGKDQSEIIVSLEELGLMLPDRLSNILLKNEVDRATWEQIIDIFEEESWGENIVLRRDIIRERQHVKVLHINSKDSYRITNEVIQDLLEAT